MKVIAFTLAYFSAVAVILSVIVSVAMAVPTKEDGFKRHRELGLLADPRNDLKAWSAESQSKYPVLDRRKGEWK